MNFWNQVILGNPLKDWAFAIGIIALAMVVVKLIKGPLLGQLIKWTSRTDNSYDDLIVMSVRKFIIPFLYFVAVYAGLQYLVFSRQANDVIHVAALLVITFFILRLISAAVRYLIFAFLRRQENSDTKQKQARGLIIIINAIVWVLGLVFLIDNLGYNVTTIITGLGIGGIAIALAAQTILGDLFSYFVIFFDRPFEIGDFITVDDKAGAVEYIGIKTTRLRAPGGEQVICSNKDLTDSRVHNFRRMITRRVVFNLRVVYQTPVVQVKKIPAMIKELAEAIPGITFDRCHLSVLGDFSLNFETVYFVDGADYNGYMDLQQKIYLAILERFEQEKIEFAYPTQRVFANNSFEADNQVSGPEPVEG